MRRTNRVVPVESDAQMDAKPPLLDIANDTPQTLTKQLGSANLALSANEKAIRRLIVSMIESDDKSEKKNFGKEILELMKLEDPADVNDINRVIVDLLQLGFSGRVESEQIFAQAIYNAVCIPSDSRRNDGNIHKSNMKTLFQNPHGRDLLRRIIWCSSRSDLVTSQYAQDALNELCKNSDGK